MGKNVALLGRNMGFDFRFIRLIHTHFLLGFSDDHRPNVNSGDVILLPYKPSTLLKYLFYELQSIHHCIGPGNIWSPVRLSDWLLQNCQADCLASVLWLSYCQSDCFQAVRLTALLLYDPMVSGSHYTHTHTWVLALVWQPTGLALSTGQWAIMLGCEFKLALVLEISVFHIFFSWSGPGLTSSVT